MSRPYTPSEFYQLCLQADWFYEYSDDQRAWRAGQAQCAELARIASEQPELKPIYDGFMLWGSRKGPQPTEPSV